MAFNDTLFQLGMDLTRSSPAQEEDLHEPARVVREDTKSTFTEREGVRFAGQHLIIDLFGARKLDDLGHMERTLKRCVEASGATLLHMHVHPLRPSGGVTGVAVLAESHISVHTWPETGYAAFDVFMSGDADPALAIPVLKEAFAAADVVVKSHLRGEELEQLNQRVGSSKRREVRPRAQKKAKVAA
ncbi:MAG: adenosylmethionine decarboxylase [Hyphomicrobium sp.]|jgi:S-adenosylmethionine decarboxylase